MVIEIVVFLYILIAALILYKLVLTLKRLIYNALIGLLILFGANLIFNLNIAYSWVTIAICSIGGIFGSFLVIFLHITGIYF